MTILDEHWEEIWKLLTDIWKVEEWRHGEVLPLWKDIEEGKEEDVKSDLSSDVWDLKDCKDVAELRKSVCAIISFEDHTSEEE